MVWKNILEIWREISFLEISSVFKDIVLAISEFYPLAQWRANTAGHSHNKWNTQKYMNVTKKQQKIYDKTESMLHHMLVVSDNIFPES